ncbi:hypothetical protein RYZ26_12615 [Terasakiella sp. A23]|uniref:hypothetical protein n=1 Tax=Terasakiella sp. FCG-A23 TaxID=3080561 RepID=UPI002952CC15|nr:hypothetical protein [Terasakiella sp. A23]MDV7340440.1 hypothetical protein [Terasakiella sp. A23]
MWKVETEKHRGNGSPFLTVMALALVALLGMNTFALAQPLNIGVMLWRGPTAADQMFIKTLKETYPDLKVAQANAAQNIRKTVETIQVTWKNKLAEMDYLFAFGSRNAIQVRKTLAQTDFKGVLVALSNSSTLLDAFTARPTSKERLLLGQTSIPDHAFFDAFAKLLSLKQVAVPFNIREPQNAPLLDGLSKTAKAYNIEIVPVRTKPDPQVLKQQLDYAFGQEEKIDVVYCTWDSFLLSEANFIADYLLDKKMLGIGSQSKYVKAGFPLGIDSDYGALGRNLAKQVIAIEKGADVSAQPIVKNMQGRFLANRASLTKIAPDLIDRLPEDTLFLD